MEALGSKFCKGVSYVVLNLMCLSEASCCGYTFPFSSGSMEGSVTTYWLIGLDDPNKVGGGRGGTLPSDCPYL